VLAKTLAGVVLATVLVPVLAWSSVVPDERSALVASACLVGLFALFCLLLIVAEARDEYTLVARPTSLKLTRRLIRRPRQRRWNRADIISIATELQFRSIPDGDARLVIASRDGKSYKLTGKPLVMRHLATLLRRKLQLGCNPATSAPPDPTRAI
jgi:hypothetical protein